MDSKFCENMHDAGTRVFGMSFVQQMPQPVLTVTNMADMNMAIKQCTEHMYQNVKNLPQDVAENTVMLVLVDMPYKDPTTYSIVCPCPTLRHTYTRR